MEVFFLNNKDILAFIPSISLNTISGICDHKVFACKISELNSTLLNHLEFCSMKSYKLDSSDQYRFLMIDNSRVGLD